MVALLNAANASELADLHDWLQDHPADTAEDLRWKAQSWLGDVMDETDAYPAFIAVPSEFVEVIDAVIEDWTEILTAHDEGFLTTLQVSDE
jgi:hypothetical protein